ncbi:MAG: hypothetical protein KatS3mg115_1135 [Candidatus Poribacteria bacterium]|nr:MAG: hypothetical protein KatS3mg115_1135 [Candidatus Poribacteria bacterium]
MRTARTLLLTVGLGTFLIGPLLRSGAQTQVPRLEGVPERVEGRIVDVTAVYAERSFSVPTDLPERTSYLAVHPKERPWRFPATRPGHRRLLDRPEEAAPLLAQGEMEATAPGRLRMRFGSAFGAEERRGGLRAGGEFQTDAYTQERDSTARLSLGGFLRQETPKGRFLSEAAYRWEQFHRLRLPATGWGVGPGVLSRGRGDDGRPGEAGRSDRQALLEVAGVSPWPLPTCVEDRRAAAPNGLESGSPSSPFACVEKGNGASLRVGRSSNYSRRGPRGSRKSRRRSPAWCSWGGRIRGSLFRPAGWTGRSARRCSGRQRRSATDPPWDGDVPFRLGWTGAPNERFRIRIEGLRAVELFPVERLDSEFFSMAQTRLPARRTWKAQGEAGMWLLPRALLEVSFGYVAHQNEWQWLEVEDDLKEKGVFWAPTAEDAKGFQSSLRLQARGASVFLYAQVVGDFLRGENGDRLPYRPDWRGDLWLSWKPDPKWRMSGELAVRGRRYTAMKDMSSLDPYARISLELEWLLVPQLSLYGFGQFSLGKYREYRSSDDRVYQMNQNAGGIGVRARL